jgi:hypothetical protein
MDGWVCASFAPEPLKDFIKFGIQVFISILRQCSVNLAFPAPNMGDLQIGPKIHGHYFENG